MMKGLHRIFVQPGTLPAASVFYLSIATYGYADFTMTFYDVDLQLISLKLPAIESPSSVWPFITILKRQNYEHIFPDNNTQMSTAWNVSKYGVFSGSYFPVFSPNTGKYTPEKTPYLDTFHEVEKEQFGFSLSSTQYYQLNEGKSSRCIYKTFSNI